MKNYGVLSKDELKNLSLEELKEAREYFEKEKEINQDIIDDKNSKSTQLTDAYRDDSDIKERLDIINNGLNEEPTLK